MSLICLQLGGPSLARAIFQDLVGQVWQAQFSGKGNVPRLGGPSLASAIFQDLVGPSLARDLSLSAWPQGHSRSRVALILTVLARPLLKQSFNVEAIFAQPFASGHLALPLTQATSASL